MAKEAISPVRPVTARLVGSIFNILVNGRGYDFTGKRGLDLYCGLGTLGKEALRRGARSVLFVDRAKQFPSEDLPGARFLKTNALAAIADLTGETFDFIFVDPPFYHGEAKKALLAIFQHGTLGPSGFLVARCYWREGDPTVGLNWKSESRRVGENLLLICQAPEIIETNALPSSQ